MGQKVNPIGMRVGVNKEWESKWFADKKNFANFILEDNNIRDFIENNYKNCSISKACVSSVRLYRVHTQSVMPSLGFATATNAVAPTIHATADTRFSNKLVHMISPSLFGEVTYSCTSVFLKPSSIKGVKNATTDAA